MVQLYNLAQQYCQRITGNQRHLTEVLKDMINTQEKENEHLLQLVNNQTSPQVISQAIRTAQERNQELKRKYNDLEDADPSSAEVSETEDNDDQVVGPINSLTYTTAMEFVKNYKQTRIKNGQNRMDWIGCLAEGKEKDILHNKNTELSLIS